MSDEYQPTEHEAKIIERLYWLLAASFVAVIVARIVIDDGWAVIAVYLLFLATMVVGTTAWLAHNRKQPVFRMTGQILRDKPRTDR